MEKFTARTAFNTVKIFDDNGYLVATFNDEGREVAYGMFRNGLVAHGGYSLFDESAGQYLVGTVAQMVDPTA